MAAWIKESLANVAVALNDSSRTFLSWSVVLIAAIGERSTFEALFLRVNANR